MKEINVNVYTKSPCVQCDATKRRLNQHGIPFTEIPLDDSSRATIMELGFRSAPVVLADGHEPWDGYRPDRIDKILKGMNNEEQAS